MLAEITPTEPQPRPTRRGFWLALSISAFLHALVLLSGDRWWTVDLPEVDNRLPPPLEATLQPPRQRPAPPKAPEPAPTPRPAAKPAPVAKPVTPSQGVAARPTETMPLPE
ncbi:MAG TPA: hypothetical protein VLW45_01290, partial [Pelomicrobium sp.]|nr:hypothetical protein [Pelomicrobium sp.]